MSHGKLVRDNIPRIIRSQGLEPVTYTAGTDEYGTRLRDKLREEAEEFLASDNDPEELADILEVLYALAGQAGIDREQLERLRAAKAEERGSFAGWIIWTGNLPQLLSLSHASASRWNVRPEAYYRIHDRDIDTE